MEFGEQKLKKKPLPIVGDGNQKRDFTHVYDIVDGLIKIAFQKLIIMMHGNLELELIIV